MLIDQLNLNQLRVFHCVYKTQNMTEAALELHLTQSGISQHIKSLEEALGVTLFDRVRKKILPTPEGETLFQKCEPLLLALEDSLSELKGDKKLLKGKITIGVPLGFGNSVILPLMSEFCASQGFIDFEIRYGFVNELSRYLLDGEIDFGFIDGFGTDARVSLEPVFEEVLELYCRPELFIKKIPSTLKEIEALPYVDYHSGAPVLQLWFQHHFQKKMDAPRVRATAMDVLGVSELIATGLGAGILPVYFFQKHKNLSKLVPLFKKDKPLKNRIYLARLKERRASGPTTAAIEFLKKKLSQIKS